MIRRIESRVVFRWAACAFASAVLAGCGQAARQKSDPPDPIARGKYLVAITGCNDCHTPKKMGPNGPEPDASKLMAGHPEQMKMPSPPALPPGPWAVVATPALTAWSGPWGVSFAANLTPDRNTGLGIWTEDMFVKAMRTGRHMGTSRPILPPMPWQDFAAMSDDDLKAVFAYLRSLPSVVNHVPDPIPPGSDATSH